MGQESVIARAMGGHLLAPRYYSQCQSAATSEVVKRRCPGPRVIGKPLASRLQSAGQRTERIFEALFDLRTKWRDTWDK